MLLRSGRHTNTSSLDLSEAISSKRIFGSNVLNDSHFRLLVSQLQATFDASAGSKFLAKKEYDTFDSKPAIIIGYGQVEIASIKLYPLYGSPMKINHTFSSYDLGETADTDVPVEEFLDILMDYAKMIKQITPNFTKNQRAIFANLYDIAHHYTRGEVLNSTRDVDNKNKLVSDLTDIVFSKHSSYWKTFYAVTNFSGTEVKDTEDAPQEWLETMFLNNPLIGVAQ